MSERSHAIKAELRELFNNLEHGRITYTSAQLKAQPLIDELNDILRAKTNELNKKYGTQRRPALQDFVNLRRSQELL